VRRCSVTLLTNGYSPVPTSFVDEVVLSIKAVTPSLHLDYTGRDNKPVLQAFEKIAREKQLKLYAETVLIPRICGRG
jgi:pyruvate formate lyase activating enzyme